MRFTYTRYRKGWQDHINLESLLESLSGFLLDGGFAGGPHFHPYWGWSGLEDTTSVNGLKQALLRALVESGDLTPEMMDALRGEDPLDPAIAQEIAALLDRLVERLVEAGYISLGGGASGREGGAGPGPVARTAESDGHVDEAREAALGVQFSLTRLGLDFLGYRALRDLLGAFGRSSAGAHQTNAQDTGVEADAGSRRYEFGDTLNLDIPLTLKKAIARAGAAEVPIALGYSDLMVHQTDYRSSCATVVMLDISHSMILYGEDRFSPAKRVALALSHLIRTEFPGDTLRLVTFGDRAQEVPLALLGRAQVGPFHTNTAEGLQVARRILRSQRHDMRQIIMITDGKPSAVTLPSGRIYRNSAGLDSRILGFTFRQAAACRRAGIAINTFMLGDDADLIRVVRHIAGIAGGKAYMASPITMGQHVMQDFITRNAAGGRTPPPIGPPG